MTATAIAGGVGDAHALETSRIVGGKFLPLGAHEHFGVLEFLAHPFRSFGQFVAESFAVGGRFGHANERFGGAKLQRQFDLMIVDDTALVQFHRGRQRGSHRDRIHAQIVTQPVGFQHGVQIADSRVRSQGPGVFVFGAFTRLLPVARMHVDQILIGVSPKRVTRPQAIVQAKQALLATRRVSLIVLPLRFS